MDLTAMKLEELKAEAMSLHDVIYNQECYGTKDLLFFRVVVDELERRGVEVKEVYSLEFE